MPVLSQPTVSPPASVTAVTTLQSSILSHAAGSVSAPTCRGGGKADEFYRFSCLVEHAGLEDLASLEQIQDFAVVSHYPGHPVIPGDPAVCGFVIIGIAHAHQKKKRRWPQRARRQLPIIILFSYL
ncbi:MAG TPA: hypothetical protein PK196_08005, partial [Methanoculleus sp.]|nr:hypothetical protein [Methanoculleus sp.]